MADRFTGTMLTKLLTQGGLPEDPAKAFGKMSEETDKALLDLLKKVNDTAASAADKDATDASLAGLSGSLTDAIKGMKYGLDISYVSSDTLTIIPGAVEVNGELVVCPNALSIMSSMANFPAAGSWAFVTMERGGVPRLFPATGTADQRPTNSCFQWSGGGVGFLDLAKQGYYYDPERRIIGAIHKVNATTWFAINLETGPDESGRNAAGYWRRFSEGTLEQWGQATINTVCNLLYGSIYYGPSYTIVLPVQYINNSYNPTLGYQGSGTGGIMISGKYVGGFDVYFWNGTNASFPSSPNWHTIGRWRA